MKKRGFELIETVIGSTIFWMVAAAALGLFSSSAVTMRYSEDALSADTFAQSFLEEYQPKAFSRPLGTVSSSAPHPDWAANLEIRSVPGEDPLTLRELRATVRWTYQNRPRRLIRSLAVLNTTL